VKPSIGRIVHFVQNNVHYAALVVKVWTDTTVNLRVFPNGSDEIVPGAIHPRTDIATSVSYSSDNAEWSWHWPERE
jgi:hypothetical protein